MMRTVHTTHTAVRSQVCARWFAICPYPVQKFTYLLGRPSAVQSHQEAGSQTVDLRRKPGV